MADESLTPLNQLLDKILQKITDGSVQTINGTAVNDVKFDSVQSRLINGYQATLKGCSAADETEAVALASGVGHFHLDHQCSSGSTRRYKVNLNSGLPTANGSLLLLTIYSNRTNTDGVSRTHESTIQLEGVNYLTTGGVLIAAAATYEAKLSVLLVKTSNGWFQVNEPHVNIIQAG